MVVGRAIIIAVQLGQWAWAEYGVDHRQLGVLKVRAWVGIESTRAGTLSIDHPLHEILTRDDEL